MADFLLLMHDDAPGSPDGTSWPSYLDRLRQLGVLDGGSAIGAGETFRKAGSPAALTAALGGYIRVQAADMAAVRDLLAGNPVYEAGGTVEIRELPRS